jgi:hypothetical protein
MLDIIHRLIKETINEYMNHKLNTIYDLSEFIYTLNNTIDTTFYVLKLDSLISIHLFPYYLSRIKHIDIYQLVQNISNDQFDNMKQDIINSDYFNEVEFNDPFTFLGCYYIYYLHEHKEEIQSKLLHCLHSYRFHI